MQNFEVEILDPKVANILYDLQEMNLIKLKEKKTSRKVTGGNNIIAQIEKGLKDVSKIKKGKVKPKTLTQILNEK